jgi:putative flippase GtrA
MRTARSSFLPDAGGKGALTRQFTAYVAVGVIGTAIDFGLFWVLLRLHVPPPAAVTLAYGLATALQFFLNRHWTFRAFDRAAVVQAGTYLAVTLVNWIVALVFVEAGTYVFHLTPLVAKALSIPPSAVVGFLGNRYLTFGAGVRGTMRDVRAWLRRRKG